MPRELNWTDTEEIGIQLQEMFPDTDPYSCLLYTSCGLGQTQNGIRGLRFFVPQPKPRVV